MAAANGFVTTTPDARYGDADSVITSTQISASAFSVPGTGTKNVTRLGGYLSRTTTNGNVKLAIFEDDAANGCPGAMVANSETSALSLTSASYTNVSHAYGTLPQVTGGAKYWIATIADVEIAISRFDTGGEQAYKSGITAYTWPAENDWHTNSDFGRDQSFYAVYEDATSGLSIPVAMHHYSQQ